MSLIQMIKIAEENKPEFDEPCNHCGWCCMVEVCSVGKSITNSETIPCSLLEERDGKHYCSLGKEERFRELIGMGVGCDAMTQEEMIRSITI